MGKWLVSILASTSLFISGSCASSDIDEKKLAETNKRFLRLECQQRLPDHWEGWSNAEILGTLLNSLEARTRGFVPPYDAQRCADWGYPPLDLPDVPEGWEDSPFTELIGELHMTEEYEQDLKDECRGIFPPRSISHLSLADQEKVMQGILEWRAAGVIARYSLKRCLDWGILPPGEKTDL